jgi:histone H4
LWLILSFSRGVATMSALDDFDSVPIDALEDVANASATAMAEPPPQVAQHGGKKRLKQGTVTVMRKRRAVLRRGVEGITKSDIRRLARRGGVKRMNGLVYNEVRGVLQGFLHTVIEASSLYMENAGRKTITSEDVVNALRHRVNVTLYT